MKKSKTCSSSSKSVSSVIKAIIDGQEMTFTNKVEYQNFLEGRSASSEQPTIISDDDTVVPEPDTSVVTRKRKTTSPVWKLFDKNSEKEIATCRICKQEFTHRNGSGTGTLTRHFVKHPGWDEEKGEGGLTQQ